MWGKKASVPKIDEPANRTQSVHFSCLSNRDDHCLCGLKRGKCLRRKKSHDERNGRGEAKTRASFIISELELDESGFQ